jgi:ABC-type glycerol-3-phosphate transport system substrate-binding protein
MGLLQNNFMSGTYDEQLELFGQGKVAVLFQLSGIMNSLRDKFGLDFVNSKIGWFPMPAADGPGVATLQPPSQILIPSKGKNVNVALELAHFMTEKANLDIWYKHNPGVPAYKDVTVSLYAPELTVVEYNNQGKALVNIQNRLQSSFADYPKLLQQMYIDGDVDKVLNMLDENYRRTGKARVIPGF